MKRAIIFLLVVLCGALSGCSRADSPQPPVCRVVTQIDVAAAHNGTVHYHTFTDSEKMETILNYLRLVQPAGNAEIQPDTFRADAFQITLSYSDSGQTTYYQIYNDYLRKDNGFWKTVDQDQAAALPPLLISMPSDG